MRPRANGSPVAAASGNQRSQVSMCESSPRLWLVVAGSVPALPSWCDEGSRRAGFRGHELREGTPDGTAAASRWHQKLRSENVLKGGHPMRRGEHVQGVGEKEQKMYEHIVHEAKQDHRYGKRAEEVAARTVLKNHHEEGHDKGE